MTELSSQFNCPQCGKPQYDPEFGFVKCFHPTNEIQDPCVFCGESTAPGGMNKADPNDPESIKDMISKMPIMNPKFINRIPADNYDEETGEYKNGYACADCMSEDCTKCGKQIPLDEEISDKDHNWYHHGCLDPKKAAEGYEDCECEDCEKWRK